ncbi:hypothetical protein WA026_022829 [Henosepilachna vigintioctopunctata]|uniref:Reverse transcriptase domain-containing protein n=1 Tax=Henosepilachna vigintioctopunctata TaxID=420089 RepID=A0AAW1V394_9CUCU
MDRGQVIVLVLLDQSQAFDLVHDELIVSKLKYIGLGDAELDWFRNYISEREQCVKVGNVTSDVVQTRSGVPQGSVLGPLLFSVYTSDLPEIFSRATVHMYADDVQLYAGCAPDGLADTITDINLDLQRLQRWCTESGLKLNANKTKVLLIGSKYNLERIDLHNMCVSMNGEDLQWEKTARDLGLWLDDELSFGQHLLSVKRASVIKLKGLHKYKYELDVPTKLQLVRSLIYPIIDYCLPLYYYHLTQTNKDYLKRIHNMCIRFVCNVPFRHHITPYRRRLGEMSVSQRAEYSYITFLYKLFLNKSPEYLFHRIGKRQCVHDVNTRFRVHYDTPRHRTSKFEGCFDYCAPEIMNKFFDLLNAGFNVNTFKRRVKDIILQDVG